MLVKGFLWRPQDICTYQRRIQDFPEMAPTPKVGVLTYYFAFFFAENCMKMKEFGPQGGVPGAPLDPPMLTVQTGNYLLILSGENIAMVIKMLGRIRDGMDPFTLNLIF